MEEVVIQLESKSNGYDFRSDTVTIPSVEMLKVRNFVCVFFYLSFFRTC